MTTSAPAAKKGIDTYVLLFVNIAHGISISMRPAEPLKKYV